MRATAIRRPLQLCLLSTSLLASVGCSLGPTLHPRPFDSRLWAVWKPGNLKDNTRWEMVEDLDRAYLREGRTTRREVLALLGKPSESHHSSITYFVGDDGWDPVLLTIIFDGSHRVLTVQLKFT